MINKKTKFVVAICHEIRCEREPMLPTEGVRRDPGHWFSTFSRDSGTKKVTGYINLTCLRSHNCLSYLRFNKTRLV